MEVLGNNRAALVEGQIGLCHRNLGLTALASADFKQAVSLMPFDAEAHYQLALADATLGRTPQSLSQLKWSFETAPSQAELRRYLVLSKVESDFGAVRGLPGYAARLRFLTQDIEKAKANLRLSLKRAQEAGRRADLIKFIQSSAIFSSMADDSVLSPLLNQAGGTQTDQDGDGSLHDSISDRTTAVPLPLPSLSPDARAVLSHIATGDRAFGVAHYAEALKSY